MPPFEQMFALHRYFVWANRQREESRERCKGLGLPPADPASHSQWLRLLLLNLAPWLGSLFVVVEGWQTLALSDKRIAKLLESPHVHRLKRFRNGVFHYQPNYFDDRFLGLFVAEGPDWALRLHDEFSRYFKAYFQKRGMRYRFRHTKGGDLRLTVWQRHAPKA